MARKMLSREEEPAPVLSLREILSCREREREEREYNQVNLYYVCTYTCIVATLGGFTTHRVAREREQTM